MHVTEDIIWDYFTDFDNDGMADIASRVLDDFYVFKTKNLSETLKEIYKENKLYFSNPIARTLELAENGDLDLDLLHHTDVWCILDLEGESLKADFDLMDMLTDYEDLIIQGIMDDDELMSEIRG